MDGICYKLAIPNREIWELFSRQAGEWFRDMARADAPKLERFCQAFLDGDAVLVEQMLGGYLWDSISIRDTAARTGRKENFYHGMLLGLLQYEENWAVDSNVESGGGYCDISIETPEKTGVVIEVKYAPDGNLEKACAAALSQIEQKGYDAVLKKDGMTNLMKYGIAFYKKNCKVVLADAL